MDKRSNRRIIFYSVLIALLVTWFLYKMLPAPKAKKPPKKDLSQQYKIDPRDLRRQIQQQSETLKRQQDDFRRRQEELKRMQEDFERQQEELKRQQEFLNRQQKYMMGVR